MSELTLSEAIRLGSMLRPKAVDFFFIDGRSCAQGAALEAVGCSPVSCSDGGVPYRSRFIDRWPWVSATASCPVCGGVAKVRSLIAHLNNTGIHSELHIKNHGWTREQIADWIQTLESAIQQTDASVRTDPAVAGTSLVSSGSPVRV
jgi:hypothetical protein